MNDKHKTQRKPLDSESFSKLLDDKANDAYKRPWHRLERGLRLNRLRVFAETEAQKTQLSQIEKAALLNVLQKGLDKKLLNSKTTVVYDQEQETILEIKGLVMHRGSDGFMKFQLIEKKVSTAGTRRKRDDDGSATATQPATQPQQQEESK
jgi:hypothetical protein